MFTYRFSSFICPGDVITCEAGPFTVLAQVVPDDCPDAPDQRQDGFWPSLYIGAPGFIGPGNGFRQRFADAQARAEAVMEGWRKGDWFYCGIVLSVSLDGVDLAPHAASLCRAQHKLAYVASMVMRSCCGAALILRAWVETPLNIIEKLLLHSAEGDQSCVQHFHGGLKSRPYPGQTTSTRFSTISPNGFEARTLPTGQSCR